MTLTRVCGPTDQHDRVLSSTILATTSREHRDKEEEPEAHSKLRERAWDSAEVQSTRVVHHTLSITATQSLRLLGRNSHDSHV